jgi:hypothetical protein
MKKLISLVLALVMAFSLCGCNMSDYKKAQNAYENGDYENASTMFETLGDYKESQAFYNKSQAAIYDEKIKAFVNDWTGNISDAEALYTDYKNLSDEIKAEMSYCEDFERTFPVYLVDYVSTLKNDNIEEIKRIIREYSECMDENQLATCMIYFGQWDAVEKAEDFLKENLKNPHSYHRYSGKVSTPEEHRDFAYCTMYVVLEYGATNSYGAEVESTDEIYIWFSYDTAEQTITYGYIGFDKNERDKSTPNYYASRSLSAFSQNMAETFSAANEMYTSGTYDVQIPSAGDYDSVKLGQWVALSRSAALNCDFYAITANCDDIGSHLASVEVIVPVDEMRNADKEICAIFLMIAAIQSLDPNASVDDATEAIKKLYVVDVNSDDPTTGTQYTYLNNIEWSLKANKYMIKFCGTFADSLDMVSKSSRGLVRPTTMEEKYALATAISGLNITDLSEMQMTELLKNDGFSNSQIEYAMENCGGKWNTDSN